MSFDTTARVAPKEQEMPACLPLVSFYGRTKGQSMRYETQTGITFTFMHNEHHEEPFVVVKNVPGIHGVHTYKAAGFLDAAATNSKFTIGADWDDQQPFVLDPHEVMAIAYMVRSQTDRKRGFFEVRWVALDPSVPF